MAFIDIPPRESGSERMHVLIDTPAGSRNKYKYDERFEVLRLSRILPRGAAFPYDFGSIPGTSAEDSDALDVLVLQLPPSFPGCLVTVRLIGVADTPVNPARLKELSALDEEELRAIEHFLRSYNAFQGREFDIKGRGDSREAMRVLDRAIDAHSAHGS